MVDYINKTLPPDARVMTIGFPVRRRYISGIFGGENMINRTVDKQHYTAEDLAAALKMLGITHIVKPLQIPYDEQAYKEFEKGHLRLLHETGKNSLYEIKW